MIHAAKIIHRKPNTVVRREFTTSAHLNANSAPLAVAVVATSAIMPVILGGFLTAWALLMTIYVLWFGGLATGMGFKFDLINEYLRLIHLFGHEIESSLEGLSPESLQETLQRLEYLIRTHQTVGSLLIPVNAIARAFNSSWLAEFQETLISWGFEELFLREIYRNIESLLEIPRDMTSLPIDPSETI